MLNSSPSASRQGFTNSTPSVINWPSRFFNIFVQKFLRILSVMSEESFAPTSASKTRERGSVIIDFRLVFARVKGKKFTFFHGKFTMFGRRLARRRNAHHGFTSEASGSNYFCHRRVQSLNGGSEPFTMRKQLFSSSGRQRAESERIQDGIRRFCLVRLSPPH